MGKKVKDHFRMKEGDPGVGEGGISSVREGRSTVGGLDSAMVGEARLWKVQNAI